MPVLVIGFIFIEQKCHSRTKGKPSQPTVFYSRLHRQFFKIRPVNGQSSSGIDFSVCSRIFPRFSVLVLRTCGSCWCPRGGWPVLANCCSLDLQLAEPGALCIDTGHHRPEDRVPRLGRRFQNKTKSQIWSSARLITRAFLRSRPPHLCSRHRRPGISTGEQRTVVSEDQSTSYWRQISGCKSSEYAMSHKPLWQAVFLLVLCYVLPTSSNITFASWYLRIA